MKEKHIRIRIEQCLTLAKASNCPRRKFGALLLDPERNVVLMDGYNGAPRGGGELCGGATCLRDDRSIQSGTRMEIGCHHAEMNVICNSAAAGVATKGGWILVTGEPCVLCAKLIHHAVPQCSRGAQFRHFHEEVHADAKEERQPSRKGINIKP